MLINANLRKLQEHFDFIRVSFRIVFLKSCVFEGKIRSKTQEALSKDHESWFKFIKAKKLIPETGRKTEVHETEKSTDIIMNKSDEFSGPVESVKMIANKKMQEKYDAEFRSVRKMMKITLIALICTLLLFMFSAVVVTKKISNMESHINKLENDLSTHLHAGLEVSGKNREGSAQRGHRDPENDL
jgi:hypothetical protein